MLIDGHNDLAWAMRQLHNYDFDALDLSQYAPALHTDLSSCLLYTSPSPRD